MNITIELFPDIIWKWLFAEAPPPNNSEFAKVVPQLYKWYDLYPR